MPEVTKHRKEGDGEIFCELQFRGDAGSVAGELIEEAEKGSVEPLVRDPGNSRAMSGEPFGVPGMNQRKAFRDGGGWAGGE